jgi:hypothetical protein
VAVAGDDVKADWLLHLLGSAPQAFIVVSGERQILRRHLPDQDAAQAKMLAAAHFGQGVVDIER